LVISSAYFDKLSTIDRRIQKPEFDKLMIPAVFEEETLKNGIIQQFEIKSNIPS
jgi:hypothetical protein